MSLPLASLAFEPVGLEPVLAKADGPPIGMGEWVMSSSSDRRALDVVDGAGICAGHGPHYSRRTPGSKTFTGVGQEIVLVTRCGRAVWACIRQKTPMAVGTGRSRHRCGDGTRATDASARYVWRNMIFRNLGAGLSSGLIRSALAMTYVEWVERYGVLPTERLRTEIDVRAVMSRNPGYCYMMAGWEKGEKKRGKLFLYAPPPPQMGPVRTRQIEMELGVNEKGGL